MRKKPKQRQPGGKQNSFKNRKTVARYKIRLERRSKWTKTCKDTGGPSMPHEVMP